MRCSASALLTRSIQGSPRTDLTVKEGTHVAKIALLGNYMATNFVTAADGHGGTLVTQAQQTGQQPLLTHPAVCGLSWLIQSRPFSFATISAMRCIEAKVLSLSVLNGGTRRLSQLALKWTASPESTMVPVFGNLTSSD